jgi:hypothetical protein
MTNRPLSVTIIGWLFIAAGAVGFAYHATEFNARSPFQYDLVWVCLVRLVAILGGWFMLSGHNWARWLAVAWIAYHVILSAFHSMSEAIEHGLLFVVVAFFLFRPRVTAYFRRRKT